MGTTTAPNNPLAKVGSEPKVQPEEAAVPARPKGETALSRASKRKKSEPPKPQLQPPEAPREARRLLQLTQHLGGSDFFPLGSPGKGRFALWVRWDGGLLRLDVGLRADFDQGVV